MSGDCGTQALSCFRGTLPRPGRCRICPTARINGVQAALISASKLFHEFPLSMTAGLNCPVPVPCSHHIASSVERFRDSRASVNYVATEGAGPDLPLNRLRTEHEGKESASWKISQTAGAGSRTVPQFPQNSSPQGRCD